MQKQEKEKEKKREKRTFNSIFFINKQYKENDFILQDGDGYFSAEDLKYYNSL